MSRRARGWTVASLVAAVAVLAGSVAWAAGGAMIGGPTMVQRGWMVTGPLGGPDALPALPGTVVDVVATDMGTMMGGRRTTGGWVGPHQRGAHMLLMPSRTTVAAGEVTLRLTNGGSVDHELVVLPLAGGQQIGQRTPGPDGTIDEAAGLGEASAVGAGSAGGEIPPGATGWVTLDLDPGRYELACNVAGHYAAGMYALLVVT